MYKQILGGILAVSVVFGASDVDKASAEVHNVPDLMEIKKETTYTQTSKITGINKFDLLNKKNINEEAEKVGIKPFEKEALNKVSASKESAPKAKEKAPQVASKKVVNDVASSANAKKDVVGESITEVQNKITETTNPLAEKTTELEVIPKAEETQVLPAVLEDLQSVNPLSFESTDISQLTDKLTVKSEQVLRTEANDESQIVSFTPEEANLQILEEKTEDGWYKVKYQVDIEVEKDGKSKSQTQEYVGFVHLDYIPVVEEEEKETVLQQVEESKKEVETVLISEIDKEIQKEKEEVARLEAERIAREEAVRQAQLDRDRQQNVVQSRPRSDIQQSQSSVNKPYSQPAVNKSSSPVKSNVTNNGSTSIMGQATSFLGTPYLYGSSTGTTSTFDCSSFTHRVFANLGVNLPRTSGSQSHVGITVSKDNLQVGDLVFFGSGSISHVGIYAGNGKFIGAQTSTGVSYADLNGSYWGPKFITAKRVM